jgi:hypothetical protein
MSTKLSHKHDHKSAPKGFFNAEEIEKLLDLRFKTRKNPARPEHDLTDERLDKIKQWYKHDQEHTKVYGHNEPIGKGGITCDIAVGHYMDWIARNEKSTSSFTNIGPYNDENSFLFKHEGTNLYFATVAPFQEPADFRDINLTEDNDGLLVATFMSMESPQFYIKKPQYTEKQLLEFILRDTAGIYEIEAYFDDEPINGCTVIRNEFQSTANIPHRNIMNVKPQNLKSNNTIDQIYLWQGLALKPEYINQGDHLLEFKVNSINYRISAKIQISGMVR